MPVKCRGITVSDGVCGRPTNDPSGYCPAHRKQYESIEIMNLLKCGECSFTECPKRNETPGPEHYCYYELYDRNSEADTFEKVKNIMRETIKSQRLLLRRLMRTVALGHANVIAQDGSYDGGIVKDIRSLEDSLVRNLSAYSDLCGWKIKRTADSQKEKLKSLQRMFDYEEEEDGVDLDEELTNADVINDSIVITDEKKKIPMEQLRREKAKAAKAIRVDLTKSVDEEEDES